MTEMDWDRLQPLQVAAGSHSKGSGKGCAMNVVSYINGDQEITDFPECSAKVLAMRVQAMNDVLADFTTKLLSPEDALDVIRLGVMTMGTGVAEKMEIPEDYRYMLSSAQLLADRFREEYNAKRYAIHQATNIPEPALRPLVAKERARMLETCEEYIQMFREVMKLGEAPAVSEDAVVSALR